MRTLTANATAEKNKINSKPINYIKVEWGGVIGTKYYSDRILATPVITEQELVLSWSSILSSYREEFGRQESADIEIADTSGTILGYMNDAPTFKIPVTIYQFFDGLLLVDVYEIGKGTIKGIIRKEEPPSTTLVIEDYQTNFDERLGTVAEKTIFPEIEPWQDGEILPLVIGRVERIVDSVQVVSTTRTTLAARARWNTNILVVSDSKEFVQSTFLDLMVGNEYVRGYFQGCKLTLTQRGRVLETGTTIAAAGNFNSFKANLSSSGPQWIGYQVKFFLGNKTWTSTITNYTSPNIYAFSPFFNFQIMGGTYFEILTQQTDHESGEEVYEKKESYTWIINDAPSNNVEKIEMRGSILVGNKKAVDTFLRLDESLATINTNDATWAVDLGHNVTTVTTKFDPKNFSQSPYTDNRIYATLTGVNYTNPVDILVYLAQKLGLSYPGDFDLTSETAVNTSIAWLKTGIVLKQKLTFDILFEIAFQCRISLKFIDGKLYFRYLSNALDATVKTISDDEREIDSIEILEDDQIYNKIYFQFFEDGKEKKDEVSDAVSIAKYGVKEKSLSLWCHQNRWSAESIANFYLRRWANPRKKIRFAGFLDQSELQINDVVELDFSGYAQLPGEIQTIRHLPGGSRNIDRIEMEVKTWKYPGCASSCEGYEQTGCASSCQQYCTSTAQTAEYVCQTSAQAPCSLTCVTGCELYCTTYFETWGQGCKSQCQTSCTSSAETSPTGCQKGCQTGCTTSAEDSACSSTCMITCTTSGCMSSSTGCSGVCMTSCTSTACMTGCTSTDTTIYECSTSCQGACTTAGCTTCQGGCTTGVEGCSACCEILCTTSCQELCQAGSCRTNCTATVTIPQFTSCISEAETTCLAACEAQCQNCCRAEGTETTPWICESSCQGVGCMQYCQSVTQSVVLTNPCELSCQAYCMSTAAQTGCFLYCTLGCRCFCTASCENTSCTTGAEINCACQCQTNAESHCSASTEVCWNSCQGWCMTNDTTGCAVACQGWCMSNEQTGCALYCTVACRCTCQAAVQAATCSTACEQSCECQCQTSQQVISEANQCMLSCTAGSSENAYIMCNNSCRLSYENIFYYGDAGLGTWLYTNCRTYSVESFTWGNIGSPCYSTTQYFYVPESGSAVGACYTSCRAACVSSCQDFCTLLTQTGCASTCQGWCMANVQEGCAIYCTVGCRCFCQNTCESNCRSGGVEEHCACFCQTAGCQTGSG